MSLATRLMIALLTPIALCFFAYGYVNVSLRRQEMLGEATKEVRDHGTALEVALDAFLRDRSLPDMAELTEDLSRADRTLGVMIFDDRDRPVQSSRAVARFRSVFESTAHRARLDRLPNAETRTIGPMTLYAYAFPIGTDNGATPRGAAVVLRDLEYIETNLAQSARRIALTGTLVMLVVAISIWFAVRFAILRPIASLVRGVERVGAGALDIEVAVPRADEIGRLAVAFNQMIGSLRGARAAIEAQNEANVALERRLHHAQRLSLIGQLAANLAHQVGSPLNVILGRARYALQQGGQSDRDVRHFTEIAAGAESISTVIESLLSQAKRVRGRDGPVDLCQLARDTTSFLEAECERAGVSVSLEAEPESIVAGNRNELEQVILNLCMNAIQAQPNGGRLSITVRAFASSAAAPMIDISVADDGPGIPVENRERVLEAFFTTKPPESGTGLGLAICDEIVRRHGGTIVVTEAPSGGAMFRVLLPSHSTGADTSRSKVAQG